jgi:IMP dehydrogenase/GMP reductase
MKEYLYDFDDILIEPIKLSEISSRKEIKTRRNEHLPLMTAPMDTVVDKENYKLFNDLGVIPVLPRGVENENEFGVFKSYGLDEFIDEFITNIKEIDDNDRLFILIDVANGHMKKLYDTAKEAKEFYGDHICLMVGNVANPDTFIEYCEIGVDMVRIGIGNGNGCLTTVQTGVGYPMASLIKQCYELRKYWGLNNRTKIVADGGFKKISDVIKALGLGADYVMLGSIFNKALESSGETHKRRDSTLGGWDLIDQYSEDAVKMLNADIELTKVFRGMSTKEVQKTWGKKELTTSEGVVRRNKVEYTLEGWLINFEDYLKSAMSYSGKKELHQFIGRAKFNLITNNSFKRFDK